MFLNENHKAQGLGMKDRSGVKNTFPKAFSYFSPRVALKAHLKLQCWASEENNKNFMNHGPLTD